MPAGWESLWGQYYYLWATIIVATGVLLGYEIWNIIAVTRFLRRLARTMREEEK